LTLRTVDVSRRRGPSFACGHTPEVSHVVTRLSRGVRAPRRSLPAVQLDGLTAEYVSNALYCHVASDTLRSTPSTTSSPFAIPNAWVDIQVRPDPTGYEVAVRGQDFNEAEQILPRAKAYERY
jgi:hypothetical protein